MSKVLLLLTAWIAANTITGCSSAATWLDPPQSKIDTRTIYLVNHGWHTGLVIDAQDLEDNLGFVKNHFRNGQYFEFGWGDKDFYKAKEITLGTTLKAALWPSKSTIHVVALPTTPDRYFPNSRTIAIPLSKTGMVRLTQNIADSFDRDDKNSEMPTQPGIYGDSLFFEARGTFHLFNTCNRWTARILHATGLPIDAKFTITANGVMDQVRQAMDEL